MDDMHPFEHQVAAEVVREMRPSRPVAASAVAAAISTRRSPKWRFQSMFSATKFVVAGAIVALFGGFLFTGVLTTEPSEEAPAAVASASASPESAPTAEASADPETSVSADLLPGVDLVTEEVEPGVYRVLSDGIRGLSYDFDGGELYAFGGGIIVGLDGNVWSFPSRKHSDVEGCEGSCTFYRLGDPEVYQWTDDAHFPGTRAVEVATDGTVLATTDFEELVSFDGEAWTVRRESPEGQGVLKRVEAVDDGAIWALWSQGPRDLIGRLVAGEEKWTVRRELPSKLELLVNPAGTLVLADTDGEFHRLSGTAGSYGIGSTISPPKARDGLKAGIGDDGTLWVLRQAKRDRSIARSHLDSPGTWDVYDLPDAPGEELPSNIVGVGPDGAAWLADINEGTQGLARFDGSAWTHHLDGKTLSSIDFAPDGTVWVQAWPDEEPISRQSPNSVWMSAILDTSLDTYVITPEAVAATE